MTQFHPGYFYGRRRLRTTLKGLNIIAQGIALGHEGNPPIAAFYPEGVK